MKKTSAVLWGIVLIGLGTLFALKAVGINVFGILFTGWWTLFIIIPSFIGIFTDRDKTGSFIGLTVGVLLLLCSRGILAFKIFWKLLIPAIIIIIGIKLILSAIFSKNLPDLFPKTNKSFGGFKSGNAFFSGNRMDLSGEVFDGAELNALFGGIECDLRYAIIEKDCIVKASTIFGGIDIFVPDNINVKVISHSIFGGVDCKKKTGGQEFDKTLYINASCIFGGLDIK